MRASGVSQRLTTDGNNNTPVLSPDGRVAFIVAGSGGDIYVMKDTGIGDKAVLVNTPLTDIVQDWSKDGQYVAYISNDPPTENRKLFVLPLSGDKKPISVIAA